VQGQQCVNAPPPASGQVRNAVGVPVSRPPEKRGCNGEGNPCDPATGIKIQGQPLYSGQGPFAIALRLTYNAHLTNDPRLIWQGIFGKGWIAWYERKLNLLANGTVTARRPEGREWFFRIPASGNIYPSDSDVNDRLQRLVDGGGNTTGWMISAAAVDEIELYDTTGKLLSITSRTGLVQLLTYSDSSTLPAVAPKPGLLIRVSDPFGRLLNFTYDAKGRVTAITDPASGQYLFEYDGASGGCSTPQGSIGCRSFNLTKITFPDSKTRTFFYNEIAHINGGAACSGLTNGLPNQLTGITDENGNRFANYEYDCQGRSTRTEHAGGAEGIAFTYNADGSTVVTDVRGTARTFTFQDVSGVGRNAGNSLPCEHCTTNIQAASHDANGNAASRTDFNGNVTTFGYDLVRNLETSRSEAFGTSQARTISTQWHPTFRLPVKVAEPLRITSYVYNGDSGASCGLQADGVTLVPGVLCSKTIQPTSDATGAAGFGATLTGTPRTWSYTYNANGSVLTMNGPRTNANDTTTYTYYANNDADLGKRGNVATITNALGHMTAITAYNAHGQPTTIVDPNGLTTTLGYDTRLRLTSRNVGGEITGYTYDNVGQLTLVTLPDTSSLSYTYDAAHRLTGISDNLGNRIAYTLDAMGNRTHEEVRDPANALAQTRSRAFNNLNRLFQEIGAQNQTRQYAYDNQGNVTSVTDPLNHANSNQYDALNRLIKLTDPNLGQTQYAYNGIDQLVSVTDPRNLATTYNYDGLANLNSQASPDTGTTVNTYDAAGNLLTQTDAKGQKTTYAPYDALNRVTSITFHDGSKQTYAYDLGANGIGRLSSVTETNPQNQVTSVLAYAYEAHGRVASETRTINGVAYVLAYGYDGAGRLSGLTYPSGRTVTYAFDALGRISRVDTTPAGGTEQIVASKITYQPFGGVKSYTLGNGRVYTRGFDLDGRIAGYNLGTQTFAIGYDTASRIGFITDVANAANTNTYGYDILDRLSSAVLPNLPYAYNYDASGNRTSKTVGSSTDTYVPSGTSNRLSSITPQAGATRSFAFDPNGSTTNDGINQYGYDTRGRMVQSTGALGATAYQINALGQRIRKTNSTDDRVFLYDTRGRLIAETDPGGALKREYLYLNDIPLVVFQ